MLNLVLVGCYGKAGLLTAVLMMTASSTFVAANLVEHSRFEDRAYISHGWPYDWEIHLDRSQWNPNYPQLFVPNMRYGGMTIDVIAALGVLVAGAVIFEFSLRRREARKPKRKYPSQPNGVTSPSQSAIKNPNLL